MTPPQHPHFTSQTFHTPYSAPATLTSQSLLEHTSMLPASGPLHWLFPLPGTLPKCSCSQLPHLLGVCSNVTSPVTFTLTTLSKNSKPLFLPSEGVGILLCSLPQALFLHGRKHLEQSWHRVGPQFISFVCTSFARHAS